MGDHENTCSAYYIIMDIGVPPKSKDPWETRGYDGFRY
jgi:hypothetical protein